MNTLLALNFHPTGAQAHKAFSYSHEVVVYPAPSGYRWEVYTLADKLVASGTGDTLEQAKGQAEVAVTLQEVLLEASGTKRFLTA